MEHYTEHYVVLITAPDKQEAEKIATKLVEENLAGCVNIAQEIDSVFRWEGKIDHVKEALLIVKTKKDNFPRLLDCVKSMHTYTVPEIIALPIVDGSEDYLKWLNS
ncbi:MAG: divalent-cation tolerance protein CutA [Nitrospirae bacterium]|nr:divalent-cation tolerance protein CutA [Nitrospirota bacterium]